MVERAQVSHICAVLHFNLVPPEPQIGMAAPSCDAISINLGLFHGELSCRCGDGSRVARLTRECLPEGPIPRRRIEVTGSVVVVGAASIAAVDVVLKV